MKASATRPAWPGATALCRLALVLLLSVGAVAGSYAEGAALKVLVRYDDYTQTSDAEVEEALFKAVHEAGGSVMVGVIPFSNRNCVALAERFSSMPTVLGRSRVEMLRKYQALGAIEVVAHGCNHRSIVRGGWSSEFRGLDLATQRRVLSFVKRSMDSHIGIPVTAFVPPWNAYDEYTLQALEDSGFDLISAGFIGPALEPESELGSEPSALGMLPGGVYPSNLRRTVKAALADGVSDAILVVTMHPFDIKGPDKYLPAFRQDSQQVSVQRLLADIAWLGSLPQVRLVSLAELAAEGEDLSTGRFVANQVTKTNPLSRQRLVPDALTVFPLPGLYSTTADAERIYLRQNLHVFLFHGAVLLAAALVARLLLRAASPRFARLRYLFIGIALAGLVAIGGYASWSTLYLSAAVAISLCLGLLLGSVKPVASRAP